MHEGGSAVVDFVLVSVILLVLFLGVLQVVLALHVRAIVIDSAAEGARLAGRADRTPVDGAARTRTLIDAALSERFAQDVSAREVDHDGLRVVEVTVTFPLPVVGLLGPSGAVTVDGNALEEEQ
ncbi:pilus assembly protein [Oerskovia turbata]|uniref:Pilus assembly protein n=1 Tax=Oerskovia turbata TaxID=1713 RepID=A0A4Q1L217_9CELL|nr:pilus assembly protein [Oerskovia turbata]RXR36837.1 pilus assembly protein [Oerskovia turbata]TGJ98086.1 pilus assembly protein TadE [Actinotalea fermentans ATCC 43279 = JCM 9966 = DSM 3133]